MVNNLATSPSFIANSTACRHLAMTPLLVQSQTRNPPTCFQFHRGRFHGIDRLVGQGPVNADLERMTDSRSDIAPCPELPAGDLRQGGAVTLSYHRWSSD